MKKFYAIAILTCILLVGYGIGIITVEVEQYDEVPKYPVRIEMAPGAEWEDEE
ncbi:hypothetical protein [Bacillus sp. RO1]|uniref:hypothetical protein n=1 Tax=Bacillus sp. RO1 TaxID=2722703 RepID=UPI001456493C|nr:hypothetical protein [Bacillus sp. RO1]NLP52065.1 hypothetical protein [Bacillus sp. RO1]